jgi:hypothetical protein
VGRGQSEEERMGVGGEMGLRSGRGELQLLRDPERLKGGLGPFGCLC